MSLPPKIATITRIYPTHRPAPIPRWAIAVVAFVMGVAVGMAVWP